MMEQLVMEVMAMMNRGMRNPTVTRKMLYPWSSTDFQPGAQLQNAV